MTIIACPECKKAISDTLDDCLHCGFHLAPEELQIEKDLGWISLCVICVAILFGLFVLFCVSDNLSDSSSREVVRNNTGWDSSVSQVKSWIKTNANDPHSLEFIEWSPVAKTDDGGFMVRVKFRAKNGFGGYGIANKVFYLDSAGVVTRHVDYRGPGS